MPSGPRPAPPGGTGRVTIRGQIYGHEAVNVMWVACDEIGDPVQADVDALVSEIASDYASNVMPHLSSSYTLTDITLVYLPTAGGELVGVDASSLAGGANEAVKDAGASWVIDNVIGSYYRGGHPHSFLPGVPDENVTNGSDINATAFGNLLIGWASCWAAVELFTSDHFGAVRAGTVRFSHNNAWLSPPVFYRWSGFKAGKSKKLGSQRRRILE